MDEEPEGETPIISYWWPNMTISTVNVQDPIPTAMPPAVVKSENKFVLGLLLNVAQIRHATY